VSAPPSNGLATVSFSGGPVSGGRLGSRLPFLLSPLKLFGLHPYLLGRVRVSFPFLLI
jgi:hypothetical protein